jgi:S1-C subfamily serine protease
MEAWGKTVVAGAGVLAGGPVGWSVAGGMLGSTIVDWFLGNAEEDNPLFNYFACLGTVAGDDNGEVSDASLACWRELADDQWELSEEDEDEALEAFRTGVDDDDFNENEWAKRFVEQAEQAGIENPDNRLVWDCLRMAFADPLDDLEGKRFTVGEIAEAVGIPRSDVDQQFDLFIQDLPTVKQLASFFSCLGKVAIADGEVSDQEIDQLGEFLEGQFDFDKKGKKFALKKFKKASASRKHGIEHYAEQFKAEVGERHEKLKEMLDALCHLAFADRVVTKEEESEIRKVMEIFDFPEDSFELIRDNAVIQDALSKHEVLGCGSGFFITANGYAITNHHVVEGASRVLVRVEGALLKAEVVKLNEDEDLCLLKVDGNGHAFASLSIQRPQLGNNVFAIGFPRPDEMGFSPKFTEGSITALTGLSDDVRELQFSAAIQKGNSGGPLFCDDSGAIVGVTSSSHSDHEVQLANYAIKSERVRRFLKDQPAVSGEIHICNGEPRAESEVKQDTLRCVIQVFACGESDEISSGSSAFRAKYRSTSVKTDDGPPAPPSQQKMKIWVTQKGESLGPYPREQVAKYLKSGLLNPEDLAWHDGLEDWQPLSKVLGYLIT